jgi:hypothetical protein
MKTRILISTLVAGALAIGTASSTPVTVQNPSFETAFTGDPNTGWAGGWSTYDFTGLINPPATDGSIAAYSNGGTIYQILGSHTIAEGVYTIRIDLGQRGDTAFGGFGLSVFSINGPNGVVDLGGFNPPANPPVGGWTTLEVSIPITASSTAIGGNLQLNLDSAGTQTLADNVAVDFTPAGDVLVRNASFENAIGDLNADPNANWVNADESSQWANLDFSPYGVLTPPATDRTKAAYGNGGSAYQILNSHTIAAGTYTIEVDVGRRGDSSYTNLTLGVFAVNLPGDPSFISLGGYSLASDPPLGEWSTLTVTIDTADYPAAIGGNLQLNLASPGIQTVVDNVRVTFVPSQTPTLTIQQVPGSQVRLAWPASALGWTLQTSTSLLPGEWTDSAAPVTVEGSENAVYAPVSGKRFYRLYK